MFNSFVEQNLEITVNSISRIIKEHSTYVECSFCRKFVLLNGYIFLILTFRFVW